MTLCQPVACLVVICLRLVGAFAFGSHLFEISWSVILFGSHLFEPRKTKLPHWYDRSAPRHDDRMSKCLD